MPVVRLAITRPMVLGVLWPVVLLVLVLVVVLVVVLEAVVLAIMVLVAAAVRAMLPVVGPFRDHPSTFGERHVLFRILVQVA